MAFIHKAHLLHSSHSRWWKTRLCSTVGSIGKWPRLPSSCCGHVTTLLFHLASIALSSRRYCFFFLIISWENGQQFYHPLVASVCNWCGSGWRGRGETLGFWCVTNCGVWYRSGGVCWMKERMDICSSLSLGVTERVNKAVNLLTSRAQRPG